MYGNQFQTPYTTQHYPTYQQRNNDLQMINGVESITAYQMPPNSRQILMDKNLARFYLVETDATGIKTYKTYDFVEVTEKPENDYITREEFERWKSDYESTLEAKTAQATDTNGVCAKHDTRWGKS